MFFLRTVPFVILNPRSPEVILIYSTTFSFSLLTLIRFLISLYILYHFVVCVLLNLKYFLIFAILDILGGSGCRNRCEGERHATSAGILFDGAGESLRICL